MHRPLGSRDQRLAALTAAALLATGGGAVLLDQTFSALLGESTSWVATGVAVAIVAIGMGLSRWHARLADELWMVISIAVLFVILALNLVTQDSGGGGAQLAFLFPVVYAGAFLRPAAAWTVSGTAAVCSAVSVFVLIPTERALGEYPFLLVSIVALTAVLLASGRRQDRLVAQLNALAAVDSLTGLATRRAVTDTAEEVLASAVDEGSAGTVLMLLDVDRFKLINDTFGHPVGDAVLTHLGRNLRAVVRKRDAVARFGGDELAVLLPDTTADGGMARALELQRTIREHPFRYRAEVVPVTVSIGLAHLPAGEPDLERLYIAVDIALYRAKERGRDRIELGVVGDEPKAGDAEGLGGDDPNGDDPGGESRRLVG